MKRPQGKNRQSSNVKNAGAGRSGAGATSVVASLAVERSGGDEVMTMFLEGFMPADIARETGSSEDAIRAKLERDGKNPNRYKYSPATAAEWESYYTDPDDPWSASLIADTWGVSPGLVTMALLRRGVRIRHASLAISLAARRRRGR